MIRRTSVRTRFASLLFAVAAVGAGAAQAQDDFFSQKRAYFRDEVVEGASKHPESPADAPATVTIVTADEIRRYGFRTVADILNFASIGNFTHNDRRYDFAGSRGLFFFEDFNTRILVMLNGHPLNEPWNNFGGVGREMLVPLELAERVEIVYGPSSLLYGGYSLYGLVNVVTQTGGSLAGTRVLARAGSLGEKELNLSFGREGVAGEKATRWTFLGAAGIYEADGENLTLPHAEVDYPVNSSGSTTWGGSQSGTDFERSPFAFVNARYGEFSFLGRIGSRKHGAPLAPYETIYGSKDEWVRDDKSFVEGMWEHQLGASTTVSVRAFADWYTYQEHDPYAATTDYPEYVFVLNTDDTDRGAEARISTRQGTHFLTAGAEYRRRSMFQRSFNRLLDGSTDGESYIDDRVNGSLFVAYVQEEWRPSQQWTFIAGGNWANTEPGGKKAQPRIAVIWSPSRSVAVKALYGRGFRPPSIFEADYVDYIDQINNPTLRSEEIESTELSLTWDVTPRVQAQAYGFTSTLKGLIRAEVIENPDQIEGGVLPPSGNVDDLIGTRQYQSYADVKSHGFGASTRFAGKALRGYLNVAWSKPTLERYDQSLPLAASPSWLASGGLSYVWKELTCGLSAQYVGSQLLDPSRESSAKSGDYVVANLRAAYDARIALRPVTFFVEGRNIFDTSASIAASPVYAISEVPVEGRRVVFGVEARF